MSMLIFPQTVSQVPTPPSQKNTLTDLSNVTGPSPRCSYRSDARALPTAVPTQGADDEMFG